MLSHVTRTPVIIVPLVTTLLCHSPNPDYPKILDFLSNLIFKQQIHQKVDRPLIVTLTPLSLPINLIIQKDGKKMRGL